MISNDGQAAGMHTCIPYRTHRGCDNRTVNSQVSAR